MKPDILIKSFMRHDVLQLAVETLRSHADNRLVVADDSFEFPEPLEKLFWGLDVELHRIGPDIGLSAGRNYLTSVVRSESFLMMDSDFILSDAASIGRLELVMKSLRATIVGGLLWDVGSAAPRSYSGYFTVEDGEYVLNIYDRNRIEHLSESGVRYCECRFCENFFLGNAENFRRWKLRWNDDFKLMEHEDFFLRLPFKAKVAETPDVHVDHYPVLERASMLPEYKGYNGKVTDAAYSSFRHADAHKEKVRRAYGLKGDFFVARRGAVFDWRSNGFPQPWPCKIM